MQSDTTQSVSKRRIVFISVMTRTVLTTRMARTKTRTKTAARMVATAMTTSKLRRKMKHSRTQQCRRKKNQGV